MNPEFLGTLVKLSDAGIICVAIYMFLKHLASEGKANREHISDQNNLLIEFYREMHRDHISRAEEANRTIGQLVSVTEKNISATSRNTFVLETIAKSIEARIVAGVQPVK